MRSAFQWSLVAVICMVGVASAQLRPGARTAPAAAPAAAAPAGAAQAQGTADQQIAACLWNCNHNEVELAKFAEQKAKSDDVKDFAAKMIKDHSQAADRLARVAGNLVNAGTARGGATETGREVRKVPAEEGKERNAENPREDRREGREEAREDRRQARPEDRREGREEAREDRREGRTEAREDRTAVAAGGRGFNWVSVHREIAEQCLQSAKKELGSKEGNEFDKCYMGMQVAAHMKALDELKVFKNHATGQLQQDIESAIETTEHHLKDAKKIMDNIKDKPDQGGSGRKGSDRDEN